MNTSYSKGTVRMQIQFDQGNNSQHLFGRLKWLINGVSLSSENSENLGYFYVSCEYILLHLRNNQIVKNQLFELNDKDLLMCYEDWKIRKNNGKADFFDKQYFKTGNLFNCRLFHHKMIVYEFDELNIRFKSWDRVNPKKVSFIEVSRPNLTECFERYVETFDDEIARLKSLENSNDA